MIDIDERTVKAFCKEAIACAKYMGKRIQVPLPELIALVELAKRHEQEYKLIKLELIATPEA